MRGQPDDGKNAPVPDRLSKLEARVVRAAKAALRAGLRDPDPDVRAYLVGKLMRQAKPDDVFLFVRLTGFWWTSLMRSW